MSPETIAGRYDVQREVGRGGMGAVWLCRDRVLGRQVAVKQLGGLPGETAPHLARALREARASAALNHPNVVSIYDAVEAGDHVWLVMEHVPSRNLSAVLSEEGALTPRRAAFIGGQIADGLAAAHAHGTIHRDVKPGNILVGDDDLAKISDFGIARHVDDETLTQTGMVTGTPLYFSPQLARGMDPTPSDDVWALGATLYTAIEGKPPWPQEPNAIAQLVHIAENAPPAPTAAGPLTPLVSEMLSTEPAGRPTMEEVATRLHAIAGDDAAPEPAREATLAFASGPPTVERTSHPPAAPPPAPAPMRLPPPVPADEPPYAEPEEGRGRRWLPLAAVLVALALVGAIGLALVLGGGDDGSPEEASSPAQGAGGTQTEKSADGSTEASTEGSTTPAPTESSTDGGSTEPTTDAAGFVTDYYALLPSDTKSAWDLLSDDMQAEVGSYGSYKGFWATIDSVSVDDAADDGSGEVTVELTYTSDAGTESETRLITVADTGDGLQIVADQVA